MILASVYFLCFLLIGLTLYYLFPSRYQWITLLLLSLAFYVQGGYTALLYILFTTVSVWGAALGIDHINERTKTRIREKKSECSAECQKRLRNAAKTKCRAVFLLALLSNFAILCVLKYYNFVAQYAMELANVITGRASEYQRIDFLIPLGLSFYTFQAVSYLIDVYNKKCRAERNPAKFLLFVSFFPQIIQGPIGRYDQLSGQLTQERCFDIKGIEHGAVLMLWGYLMKLVIADRMAPCVSMIFSNPAAYGGCIAVVGVVFYALQLYADFAGGIFIMTGAAQMFGVQLAPNFKRPYFSTSLSDFWRRWHISLGAWMRDYLFYPLAMSKPMTRMCKKIKNTHPHLSRTLPAVIGNVIVFLVVGIWHGAQWSYIFWGLYNGIMLALSAMLDPIFKMLNSHLPQRLLKSAVWHVVLVIRTFVVVCIGYYFDRCATIGDAALMLWRTISSPQLVQMTDGTLMKLGLIQSDFWILGVSLILLFMISLLQERGVRIREWMDKQCIVIRWGIIYLLVFYVAAFAVTNVTELEAFMYAAF